MTTHLEPLFEQLAANDREITRYYRVFTILLVAGLLLHLLYASYFVWIIDPVSEFRVLLFAIFNVSALVVEIFLSRIAFMLGSRAGQLRDLQYALMIVSSGIDTTCFEVAARSIMATRRDMAVLKVLDVESMVAKIRGEKSAKDTV